MRSKLPGGIIAMSLIQFLVTGYIVLGIATELNIHYKIMGDGAIPPFSFATVLRDLGPVMYLLPAAWTIYALVRWKRNGTDFREAADLLTTGIGGLILLLVIAVMGSRSACEGRIFNSIVSSPGSRAEGPRTVLAASASRPPSCPLAPSRPA